MENPNLILSPNTSVVRNGKVLGNAAQLYRVTAPAVVKQVLINNGKQLMPGQYLYVAHNDFPLQKGDVVTSATNGLIGATVADTFVIAFPGLGQVNHRADFRGGMVDLHIPGTDGSAAPSFSQAVIV